MTVTRTPPQSCVVCKALLDATAPADESDAVPGPGDCTVCLKCGAFMIFTDDMAVRSLSVREFRELDPLVQNELMQAWYFVNVVQQEGKRPH